MYKDFDSKFKLLCEEETGRYKTGGGLLPGDYITIRKDALNNDKIKGRPSQFYDKIKELMGSKLPLKVSAIKSMRPETQNGLMNGAEAPTDYWVDVVQCASPALFVSVITLPIEILDFQSPDGNNFSPELPDQWKYDNKEQIHPKEKSATNNTEHDKRNMPRTNSTFDVGVHEPKDGRSQIKKAKEESVSTLPKTDEELISETYQSMK